MKKLAIIALFFFLPIAAEASYSVFDYTTGQFVSISTVTAPVVASTITYTGTSAFLQASTVTLGALGYCTNCTVPLCVSTAAINAFVQGSSATARCQ